MSKWFIFLREKQYNYTFINYYNCAIVGKTSMLQCTFNGLIGSYLNVRKCTLLGIERSMSCNLLPPVNGLI